MHLVKFSINGQRDDVAKSTTDVAKLAGASTGQRATGNRHGSDWGGGGGGGGGLTWC